MSDIFNDSDRSGGTLEGGRRLLFFRSRVQVVVRPVAPARAQPWTDRPVGRPTRVEIHARLERYIR